MEETKLPKYVSLFCGGGGETCGSDQAFEAEGITNDKVFKFAFNHWDLAIAVHQNNFPWIEAHKEDLTKISAEKYGLTDIDLLWCSPSCTFHSRARGGKPRRNQQRNHPRELLKRWFKYPIKLIIMENVPEFTKWGPCYPDNYHIEKLRGKPIPEKKGKYFNRFIKDLKEKLGYSVQWRILNSADYGDGTCRRRFILQASHDGKPIVWPEPTHSKDPELWGKKPWKTAAACIDWSIPVPSIFSRKTKKGKDKPLAEATQKRIFKGLMKFVVNSGDPFIVPIANYNGQNTAHPINEPLRTITASPKGGSFALVSPSLVQTGYGEREGQEPRSLDINKPLGTIVAGGAKHALVETSLLPVSSFVSSYYGNQSESGDPRGCNIKDPLPVVTCENRHALVTAFLAKHYKGATGSELKDPIGTVTGIDHHSMVAVNMIRHFGQSIGNKVSDPIGSITADGAGKTGLMTSHLVKFRGKNTGTSVKSPMPTITASGTHIGEVRAFLMKYYGQGCGQRVNDPLGTVTSKDRFGLVTIKGVDYEIVDIGLRMLNPLELAEAMSFPRDYKWVDENGKKLSNKVIIKMVGNAVPTRMAQALVQANIKIRPEVWGIKEAAA